MLCRLSQFVLQLLHVKLFLQVTPLCAFSVSRLPLLQPPSSLLVDLLFRRLCARARRALHDGRWREHGKSASGGAAAAAAWAFVNALRGARVVGRERRHHLGGLQRQLRLQNLVYGNGVGVIAQEVVRICSEIGIHGVLHVTVCGEGGKVRQRSAETGAHARARLYVIHEVHTDGDRGG